MRRQTDFEDQVVVITGAASGIGHATALEFARRKARLWVCDLSSRDLRALENELIGAGAGRARALAVDVGSAQQMADFCDVVCADGVPDVLVNNAGVGLAGGALAMRLEDWHWVVDVNLWGVVHGCHFFAPKMALRGRGQIVNVASAAGYYNSATMTAYGTTKYAVIGLSEGLRAELSPRGVGVSVVCPGFIDTKIVNDMRLSGSDDPEQDRARISGFFQRRNYPPERVARAIVKAVSTNPALLPVTPEAWALYVATRVAPDLSHRFLAVLESWARRRAPRS